MLLYYILVPLAWLVWHLVFRIQVIGRDNLKKVATPGSIIAPTHVSAIDPVFIIISRFWGKRMIVFGKKELFEINPLLTWFFRCMGGVCVRGTREELAVIDNTIAACKEGDTLLIFPEGTRVSEDEAISAKGGLSMLSVRTNSPIVPVYLDGGKKFFRRTCIVFGEPYHPQVAGRRGTAEEYQQIADEALRRIYTLKQERKV